MLLTRKVEFSASHVCSNPAWSAEENLRVYGHNANPNGHGHNYVLEVTLEGAAGPGYRHGVRSAGIEGDPESGSGGAHGSSLPQSRGPAVRHAWSRPRKTSRAEIWKRLEARVVRENARLHNVRLYETADLYVDYGGDRKGSGCRA